MPKEQHLEALARFADDDRDFAAYCRQKALTNLDPQAGAFATAYALARFGQLVGELASADLADEKEHAAAGEEHDAKMAAYEASKGLGLTGEQIDAVIAGKARLTLTYTEEFANPHFHRDLAELERGVAAATDEGRRAAEAQEAALLAEVNRSTPDRVVAEAMAQRDARGELVTPLPGEEGEAPAGDLDELEDATRGGRRQAASKRARRNGA